MQVFANYARYYDLLYRDKDYVAEAQYVHELLQSHAPDTSSILELGCGSGIHATLLAQQGYQVHGVDLSAAMLEQAYGRLSKLTTEVASRLEFSQGDIRTIRLNKQFDAVISLFHVMSYHTSNEDLQSAFATVRSHLKPGGILIFDCWYGPAVLSDRPEVRVKRLEDEKISVTRIAEPVMHPNANLVDVNYQVFIKNRENGAVEELQETHKMRYIFKPEVESLLVRNQLELTAFGKWMSNSEPGFNSWNVYFVGRG